MNISLLLILEQLKKEKQSNQTQIPLQIELYEPVEIKKQEEQKEERGVIIIDI